MSDDWQVQVRRRSEAQPLIERDESGMLYFDTGKVVLAHTRLAPGGHSLLDPGHPGAHEVCYLIAGELVIEAGRGDGRSFHHLSAGDGGLIAEGVPHVIHNPGPEWAEMVWCAAPGLGRPLVYDEPE